MYDIVISGERALFARFDATDPASYPVPPPSAIRGILENVFWHPGIYIDVLRIEILAPIQWDREGIREIRGSKQASDPEGDALPRVDKDGQVEPPLPLVRLTRCLVLRDPAWRVRVRLCRKPWDPGHTEIGKANDMFGRRLAKGQLWACPYLGVARYRALIAPATGDETPIDLTRDFGPVIHDVDYRPYEQRRGVPIPHVYRCICKRGVIEVKSFFDTVLSKKEVC